MQNNTDNLVYAGFFARLAAFLLDWLIVGTVLLAVKIHIWMLTVAAPGNFFVRDFIFQYSIKDILLYLLGVMYFVILTYFTGATLGKRAMRLRVISSEERKLSFFEVAYRESVGRFLSSIIIYIGYFMIGPDSKKRALHDHLADTRVVYYHVKEVEVQPEIRYRQNAPTYINAPQYGQNGMPPQVMPMQAQQSEMANMESEVYQPAGTPERPVEEVYQPAGTPERPVEEVYQSAETPLKPVEAVAEESSASDENF